MSATTATAPRATRREWIGLGVIALPCLLYSMDLTVLNLALPHLSAALQPSSVQLLWIMDIYGFMIAGCLIPIGHAGRPDWPPPAASDRGGGIRLGLAPVFTLATDLIVGTAPPEGAGAAAAVSETSSELGGALGIAVLGSVGTAVYRTQVAGAIPPGVPPEAASAARGTLGGALAVAERLPEHLGAALLGPAREAFTHGRQLSAALCAVIALGAAVMVARQRSSTW